MKKTFIFVLFIGLMSLVIVECNSSQSETQTATGRVIETSINFLSIETDNGDTLTYSTYDIDRDNIDKVFIEDSVIVTYNYKNGIASVSDIVVINHNLPFINNISAMLVGTWSNDDSSTIEVPNKLIFNTDSTLEIIVSNNKESLKWYIEGNTITTHDSFKTNTISIVRVDNNILTLSFSDDKVVHFDKQTERH
jgi:membrane carboxypeptidase/penicillin-binding protein PbpC